MRHSASRKRRGRRKASAGNRRRLLLLPALLLSLVLGLPTTALAYWTTTGSGQRTATTATLAAPASVTATSTTGSNSATITWTASPSGAPTGYRVERSANSGGSWTTACAQASYPSAGSCTDSGLANGTYQYRVVALKGSWTAPLAAANSITIARDTVAPTVTVARASGQATPTRTQPMSFTATFSESVTGLTAAGVQVVPGTGVQGAAVVGVTGSGTTWTITVGGLSSTAAALNGGTVTVSLLANAAQDVGGNGSLASTGTTNFVVLDENRPNQPAAPALTTDSAPSGTAAGSPLLTDKVTNTLAFNGTVPSDVQGGIVSLYRIVPATGVSTLAGSSPVATNATSYSVSDTQLGAAASFDGTYNYSVTLTDQAGNVSVLSPALQQVVVDRHAPSAPTGFSHSTVYGGLLGLVAYNRIIGSYSAAGADALQGVAYSCALGSTNCTSNPTAVSLSGGTLTVDFPRALLNLGNGTMSVFVTLTDRAGNTSEPVRHDVTN